LKINGVIDSNGSIDMNLKLNNINIAMPSKISDIVNTIHKNNSNNFQNNEKNKYLVNPFDVKIDMKNSLAILDNNNKNNNNIDIINNDSNLYDSEANFVLNTTILHCIQTNIDPLRMVRILCCVNSVVRIFADNNNTNNNNTNDDNSVESNIITNNQNNKAMKVEGEKIIGEKKYNMNNNDNNIKSSDINISNRSIANIIEEKKMVKKSKKNPYNSKKMFLMNVFVPLGFHYYSYLVLFIFIYIVFF
jgi:hypothetical protein